MKEVNTLLDSVINELQALNKNQAETSSLINETNGKLGFFNSNLKSLIKFVSLISYNIPNLIVTDQSNDSVKSSSALSNIKTIASDTLETIKTVNNIFTNSISDTFRNNSLNEKVVTSNIIDSNTQSIIETARTLNNVSEKNTQSIESSNQSLINSSDKNTNIVTETTRTLKDFSEKNIQSLVQSTAYALETISRSDTKLQNTLSVITNSSKELVQSLISSNQNIEKNVLKQNIIEIAREVLSKTPVSKNTSLIPTQVLSQTVNKVFSKNINNKFSTSNNAKGAIIDVEEIKNQNKNIVNNESQEFVVNNQNKNALVKNRPNNADTTNAPSNITSLMRNLLIGVMPKSLIRTYVKRVKFLAEELNKITIPQNDLKTFTEPLKVLGDSILKFAQIPWTRSFISIKALQIFSKSLANAMNRISSSENTLGLNRFVSLSEELGKPLKTINTSLTNFASIKWSRVFAGSKMFSNFIKTISRIPITAIQGVANVFSIIAKKINKPLNDLTPTLENFGQSLNKISNPLLKGAIAIGLLGASLIPLAYGFKQFEKVKLESIGLALASLGGIAVIIKILERGNRSIIKGALGLSLLGASLIPLSIGLKTLEDVKWKTLGIAGAALGGLVLTGAVLGKNALSIVKGAGAIALIGASLIPLSIGLKTLEGIKWKTLGIAGAALGGLALAAAGLGIPKVAGFVAIGAGVIALLGASLIPLAYSLNELSKVSSKQLTDLTPVLLDIAKGGVALALASPGLLLGGLAMLPLAAGISLLKLAVGDDGGKLLTDFLGTLNNFTNSLDPGKLFSTAGAITTLALAIAGFGAAQAIEGLGNLVGKLLRFGSDSPLEQFQKFADLSINLDVSAKSIKELASGIEALSKLEGNITVLNDFPWSKLEDLAAEIEGKSIIQVILNGSNASSNIIQGKNAEEIENRITKNVTDTTTSSVNYLNDSENNNTRLNVENNIKPASIIENVPNNLGALLSTISSSIAVAPVVIVNNTGGNTNNISNSNVNNMTSFPAQIVTGSAMGFI
jgi:hypothetical protein